MTVLPSTWRSRSLFCGCILGFLLVAFSMAFLGPIGKHLFLFGALYLSSCLFLLGLLWAFPVDWPIRRQWILIVSMALVTRLAFLSFPASFDVNRYIWEGYVLNQGFSPYVHAPDDPILRPFINEIWRDISHKGASACYPPLALLLFRLASLISPTPFFFKIVIIFFDLATIGVLARLLRSYGFPSSRLLLYALNPLVLVFIAGEGHMDAIQAFFICLCFYLFSQKREGWGFFSLGCAVMSKYFAIVFMPFLINAKNWKKGFFLFGALVVFTLPFLNTTSYLFTSLVPLGTVMHYNDSLTALLRAVLGTKAIWMSVILLGVCLSVIFLIVHEPLKSSYLAAGCLLLLLGTLHPWYLILITPFLLFFPSRAWIYLHFAVVFTFPVLHVEQFTGVFQEIQWLKLFEYLPFYGFLLWDFFRNRQILPSPYFKTASRISVVIPTLNESRNIGRCLDTLREEKAVTETIVVDGGSTDGTQEIARRMGARGIEAKKGRGNQIKAGIHQCQGDLILTLHADCLIRKSTLTRVLQELNKNRQCIGGAIGMEYLHPSMTNRLISWINNARARWTGISFGNQAQFFRKEALRLIGGFPDSMLMEDVELSMRLKENGPCCFIPKGVVVSGRRWEEQGFFSHGKQVIVFCFSYLVQRRLGIGDASKRGFYERYYSPDRA